MPVGATQFGRADLSKLETHTEAPMTQLGRAAAPGSIMVMLGLFCFLWTRRCIKLNHWSYLVCFVSVFSFNWCQMELHSEKCNSSSGFQFLFFVVRVVRLCFASESALRRQFYLYMVTSKQVSTAVRPGIQGGPGPSMCLERHPWKTSTSLLWKGWF